MTIKEAALYVRNKPKHIIMAQYNIFIWPASVVGIATGHGLDGPRSNLSGDDIFRSCPDWP